MFNGRSVHCLVCSLLGLLVGVFKWLVYALVCLLVDVSIGWSVQMAGVCVGAAGSRGMATPTNTYKGVWRQPPTPTKDMYVYMY